MLILNVDRRWQGGLRTHSLADYLRDINDQNVHEKFIGHYTMFCRWSNGANEGWQEISLSFCADWKKTVTWLAVSYMTCSHKMSRSFALGYWTLHSLLTLLRADVCTEYRCFAIVHILFQHYKCVYNEPECKILTPRPQRNRSSNICKQLWYCLLWVVNVFLCKANYLGDKLTTNIVGSGKEYLLPTTRSWK